MRRVRSTVSDVGAWRRGRPSRTTPLARNGGPVDGRRRVEHGTTPLARNGVEPALLAAPLWKDDCVRPLYSPIKPFSRDLVAVGEGQTLSVEQYGNPAGKPVVFLHGGPGSATTGRHARFFDPARYHIVLFDQRGCGRSRPHVGDPRATLKDMAANTTWRLVEDIEAIRRRLRIARWQVFGGSWGSALALAYAEAHPERVTELVLRGVFTLRRWELDWFYNGLAGVMAPAAWEDFCGPLRAAGVEPVEWPPGEGCVEPTEWPPGKREARGPDGGASGGRDNIAAYHDLLWSSDPATARAAAVAWTVWEVSAWHLETSAAEVAEAAADVRSALAFARIENHYFVHGGFLAEGQLIDRAPLLRGIPGVIVQGAHDLCCPARTAHDLAAAYPGAELRVVVAGHSAFEPAIVDGLVEATDRFAA